MLPKQCRDFMTKTYWEKFFKKLKKQGNETEYFEWYGEYTSFDHLFKNFIKIQDRVLHVGCGKSLLAEQLYDNNICKSIVNVDFEQESLDQMKLRSVQTRPEMQFQCYSLLDEIPLQDQSFDIILDKGTLDAICPPSHQQKALPFFENINRVLKQGGYYILISLLQDHIWEAVINYFKNYEIVIFETLIEKSKLYPFFVVLKKKGVEQEEQKEEKKVLLRMLDKSVNSISLTESKQRIKNIQLQNHFITQVHKLRQGQTFTIDLWSPDNKDTPRFTLFISDNDNTQVLLKKTCGCFIIPFGKELQYCYQQQRLIQQVGMSRLVIVRLNSGHKFGTLKEVSEELNQPMQDLIPKGCTNIPCPFFTDGDEIGYKKIVFEFQDGYVEDIGNLRRLVLKSNMDQIQSQVRMINDRVDTSYLDFEAHVNIVAGFSFMDYQQKQLEILILGGGVGSLSQFLGKHLNAKVTNCELSEDVILVGKNFFDFAESEQQKMICCDGLDYIDQVQNSKMYDCIIIDINCKNNRIQILIANDKFSPPKQFLSKEFLEKMRSSLQDNGWIIINVIDGKKELKQLDWDIYYSQKCSEDLNEIYYLPNVHFKDGFIDQEVIENMKKNKFEKQNWDSLLNMNEQVEGIKLKHPKLKTKVFEVNDNKIVKDGKIEDNRKEFYQEDLQKVQKKKNKKRKNK